LYQSGVTSLVACKNIGKSLATAKATEQKFVFDRSKPVALCTDIELQSLWQATADSGLGFFQTFQKIYISPKYISIRKLVLTCTSL
jgi:hypothetical protein